MRWGRIGGWFRLSNSDEPLPSPDAIRIESWDGQFFVYNGELVYAWRRY